MRVKDPLCIEQTPYEVLGVEPDADDAAVDRAMKAALGRGNVQAVTSARQVLRRPEERAVLNLLHFYDLADPFVSPSPLEDPDVLLPPRRAETAAAWETTMAERFPDQGAAHRLALLWLWWAVSREGAEADDGGPATAEMWETALGYWAMLLASGVVEPGVAKEAERRLRARLDALASAHHDALPPDQVRRLALAFDQELETGRAALAAGLATPNGPATCGPIILRRLGILDQVAADVDRALAEAPGNPDLQHLREGLSPWGGVHALLEAGRVDQAEEAIAALPADARESDAVGDLQARALAVRARQQAEAGSAEEALETLDRALETARGPDAVGEVRSEIVSMCRHRAAALAGDRRDEAIALLDRGLGMVGDDEALRSTLAEFLAQRGRETLNRAQQEASEQGGLAPAMRARFDEGAADLERAAELGSATAAADLDPVRDLLGQVRVGDVLREGSEAAERGDWDTAVANLWSAIDTLGDEAPDDLKRNLAVSLANRANATGGRAVQAIQSEQQASPPNLGMALAGVKAGYEAARKRENRMSVKEKVFWWSVLAAFIGVGAYGYFVGVPAWVRLDSWPSSPMTRRIAKASLFSLYVVGGPIMAVASVLWVWGWLQAIGKWFKDLTPQINLYGGGSSGPSGPPCDVCGIPASYEIDLNPDSYGGVKTPLCSTHAHELEETATAYSAVTIPPWVSQSAGADLDRAEADLQEAAAQAPDLDGIQESIQQLAEIRARFGIPRGTIGPAERGTVRVPQPAPAAAAVPADGDARIDINTATAAELATLPGIGPALVRRILEYREAHGPFLMPGQLANVEGIGQSTVERLLDRITVGQLQ